MPSFTKPFSHHSSFSESTARLDAWAGADEVTRATRGRGRSSSAARPPPRGILRNSFLGDSEQQYNLQGVDAAAQSAATQDAGRQRFQSSPNTFLKAGGLPTRQPHKSPSMSQASERTRLYHTPRTSDAEADRLARACGDGPFSPTAPSPYLPTEAFTGVPTRQRSQSVSVAQVQRRRSSVRAPLRDFPHPLPQQAVRSLKRLLQEETKTFKVHDYIEVEDLLSGRLWEDEDELTVDCVRDKVDEDDGHDGVWRRERRERRMMAGMRRKMMMRDQNVFGTYLQDLPESVMAPVIVGGYRHHVPVVIQASVEELYRTGLYEHGLFRTLPDRTRLFQLVAHFDVPPALHASARLSLPTLPTTTTPHASPHRASLPTIISRPTPSPRPPSLHTESYPDICALLITYLTSLPTPLIHRSLASALWAWCVSPSLLRHAQRLRRRTTSASSSSSSSEDTEEEEESYSTRMKRREEALLSLPPLRTQVALARAVLLLLPQRAFSLLVVVLAFFDAATRAPGVGLQAADAGRLIGGAVVGGAVREEGKAKGKREKREGREDRARETVAWLVSHWSEICAGWEVVPEMQRTRSRSASVAVGREDGGLSGPGRESGGMQRTRSKSASALVPNEDGEWSGFAPARAGAKSAVPIVPENPVVQRTRSRSAAAAVPVPGRREDQGGRAMHPSQKRAAASDSEDGARPRSAPEARPSETTRAAHEDSLASTPNLPPAASAPRIELPLDVSHDRLFATPAPFDVDVPDLDDDASVYSTDATSLFDLYATPLLHEPLPPAASFIASPARDGKELGADAHAAARFVLERENAELRRRLAEAVSERDEARRVVGAMRGLVGQ